MNKNDNNENKTETIAYTANEKKNESKTKKNDIKNDFIDEEINDFPYDLALKYDKRKYLMFYYSLLKTKHNLIFSFFNNNDYNSKIIKIDFFIISFAIFYTVNALFFEDSTMHNIYENKGLFDFEYQIPITIYSSLISDILNKIFEILALSSDAILTFKNEKIKEDIDKRKRSLIYKLKIKFIFYFIIGFILLLCFWYYLSMFSVVYKNTQIHLIKDTLISFILSLIYPFITLLLPGCLRITALSDPKGKSNYIYKMSKILQMF